MKITIEQTLLQAITAHKDGKIQEAERLYASILQVRAMHPDANHNLGLIMVATGRIEAALPLFKTALQEHPKIDQFWVSYINTLTRVGRLKDVKKAMRKAKKHGVCLEKLEAGGPRTKVDTPAEEDLTNVFRAFEAGDFCGAEKLALPLTQKFPEHPFGWKILGVLLSKTGRLEESLAAIKKSVQLAPQDAEAHANLATVLKKLDKLDDAAVAFNTAALLNPNSYIIHNELGGTLCDLNRLDDAKKSFKHAIDLKPDSFEAYNNLGSVQKILGELGAAEASFRKTIALKPDFSRAHNNLGTVLYEMGKMEDASVSFDQAIVINPKYAEAFNNLGILQKEQGKFNESEVSYRQAIALRPTYANAYFNLGLTLTHLDMLEQAETSTRKAIALAPNHAAAHNSLGVLLKSMDKLNESEKSLRQAQFLQPNDAGIHNNLGATLLDLNKLNEAEVSLKKAVILNPKSPNAHKNLGLVFQRQKYFKKANKHYLKALKVDPTFSDGQWSLSLFQLSLGKFSEGFELYETRFKKDITAKVATPPVTAIPRYKGNHLSQDLKDKHLIIWPEQGLGDEVMFASVLSELSSVVTQNPNTRITLVCEFRLVELFNRSFDFLTAIPKDRNNDVLVIEGNADYWMYIGSLPKFYRNSFEDFNGHKPYLKVNKALSRAWETRFSGLQHEVNIGISWIGGGVPRKKADRSLSLMQMLPILTKISKTANIINLQYGDHTQEIQYFSKQTGITVLDWKDCDPLKNIENFSAQIKALDLVISVDNSTVHFAGALGTNAYVMLPFDQDWRWAEDTSKSYWYPEIMSLFRQSGNGEWSQVIQQVIAALDK